MYGGGGKLGSFCLWLEAQRLSRLKVQVHARGRTHLGHLVHPKATDLQMEYSHIPSANPSQNDPYKLIKRKVIVAARTRGWNRQKQQQKQRSRVERRNAKTGQCRPVHKLGQVLTGPQTSQARRSLLKAGRFPQALWGHLVLACHGQVKFGAAQRQPKLAPKNLQLWSRVLLVLLKPLPDQVARGAPSANDQS